MRIFLRKYARKNIDNHYGFRREVFFLNKYYSVQTFPRIYFISAFVANFLFSSIYFFSIFFLACIYIFFIYESFDPIVSSAVFLCDLTLFPIQQTFFFFPRYPSFCFILFYFACARAMSLSKECMNPKLSRFTDQQRKIDIFPFFRCNTSAFL